MNSKAKIISKLEISDHDGYCSGGECDYECKIVENIVIVPLQYNTYPKGKLLNLEEYNWEILLPKPKINNNGSFMCKLSSKSKINEIDKHDYKYTILSVEFI